MAHTKEVLDEEVDVVEQELGGVGRYHVFQAFFQLLSTFGNASLYLVVIFIGYQPDYQCRTVENTTDLTSLLAQRNITGSVVATHYEKCSINITVMDTMGNNSHSLPCVNGIQFSIPEHTSFLTEWSLVCDSRGLTELSQTILMVGMAIGALFFSSLSDRFGRKKMYISCTVGLLGSTVGYSLAPNYLVFLAFRVLTGALVQGSGISAYTMFMELIPKRLRSVGSIIDGMAWTLGCFFLAGMAYYMQHLSWRYLSLALSSIFLYSLLMPCFLNESIRWLMATDKWNEANRILQKAKRMNGRHTSLTARNRAEPEDNLIGSTRNVKLLNVIKTKEKMIVKNSEEMTEHTVKHCREAKSSLITSNKVISEGEDTNSGQLVRDQESLSVILDNSRNHTATSHLLDQQGDFTGESTNHVDHAGDTRSEEHFKDTASVDEENKDRADSDLPDTQIQAVQLSGADSDLPDTQIQAVQLSGADSDLPDTQVQAVQLSGADSDLPDTQVQAVQLSGADSDLPDTQIQAVQLSRADSDLPDTQTQAVQLSGADSDLPDTQTQAVQLSGADSDLPDIQIQAVQLSGAENTRYKVWDLCRHREVLVPLIVSSFSWISNGLYYYGAILGSSSLAGDRFLNFAILCGMEIPAIIVGSFFLPRVNRRPLYATFGIVSSLSMLVSVCCTSLVKTDAAFTAARVLGFIGQFAVSGSYYVMYAFIPEVFPTCLRTAGMGTACSLSRISAMVAPFVVLLGQSFPWAPGVLAGCLTFLATLCVFFLPETRNRKLPDTITAIRAWRSKPVMTNGTVSNISDKH